jgi:NAD(P)-dependent dehydrogenase (short-subunit alcohol dehydrogenase family)
MSLKNKIAIATGGNSGTGKAIGFTVALKVVARIANERRTKCPKIQNQPD